MSRFYFVSCLILMATKLYNLHYTSETQDVRQQNNNMVNLTSFLVHGNSKSTTQYQGRTSLLYLSLVLLMNDVEANPGPDPISQEEDNHTYYPCGSCKEGLTWEHRGLMCETCNQWYHIDCQAVHSNT